MHTRLFFLFLLLSAFLIPFALPASAQTKDAPKSKTNVVIFVRSGCTHCEAEEAFLKEQLAIRKDFSVTYYRLENPEDRNVWIKFTERVGSSKVTPITVIGSKYVIGFDKPETTGRELLGLIEKAEKTGTPTNLEKIGKNSTAGASSTCDGDGLVPCSTKPSYSVTLPLIGKIDTQKYPLFILSALFGFFDGFNPCAMWVLITFLMILLQVGNRRKMVLFAGTFILAEAIMYTLILTAWYKTWDFVRLDTFVTPVVGIVSIIGGVLFLKEWRKKEIECKITDYKQRKEIRDKISFLATKEFTFITFLTILGIAFSVNVIEFACSIGIPQAFTKILELNRLGFLENASYILTYIVFYMVDDFIVFGIALYGMDKLALTTKYSKLSNLIGGVVMLILGLVMILKPSLILF